MDPVVVVFVGIDLKAKATIIFLSVFVPCVINSYTGIKLTKRTLINVAKTFGAGNFETFIKVGVPSAMPMVFTGIRTALGGAWSTLVAAEMLAARAVWAICCKLAEMWRAQTLWLPAWSRLACWAP